MWEIIGNKPNKKKIIYFWLGIIIFIFLLINRFIPFVKSLAPLQYDTGLYRCHFFMFINNLPNFDIYHIAKNEPPLLYILSDILYLMGNAIDYILHGWYYFFVFILALLLFIYLRKKYSIEAGLAGLFLYTASLTQFEAYWNLFYKNIIAFALTVLIFYLIEKRSYLIIVIGGTLAGVHHMSFALLIGALFLTALVNKKLRKYLLYSLLSMMIIGLLCYLKNLNVLESYLPYNQGNIDNILNQDKSLKTGSGWDIKLYLFYVIWYLPLALGSLYKKIKNKKFDYLFWYFVLSLIIIIAQLFFYKRFLVHFDFIIIILAAPFLADVINFVRRKKIAWGRILIFVWTLFLLLRVSLFSITSQPIINDNELQAVKELKLLPAEAIILSGNNYIAPWVYGYSEHETIWPGKFKNDIWNRSQWTIFWNTKENGARHELLDMLDKPLYIILADNQTELRRKIRNDSAFKCYSIYVCEYINEL